MEINLCVEAVDNLFDLLGMDELLVEYRKDNMCNEDKIIWFDSIIELIGSISVSLAK